jgi:hypothetical protein
MRYFLKGDGKLLSRVMMARQDKQLIDRFVTAYNSETNSMYQITSWPEESGAGLEKLKSWNIKFSIQEIEAHPSHLPGPFAKTFAFKAGR